jgi:DNA repair exonuclease SbcCD nuclease subunit
MNVSAILTSDLHLREDTPVCRTDDFQKTLQRKLDWLSELQQKYAGVPILDAGDLLHHWKPSPALLSWVMLNLPRPFITVPGNHDMPQHNLDLLPTSGLYTLSVSESIQMLTGEFPLWDDALPFDIYAIPWGAEVLHPACPKPRKYRKKVLLYHGLTYVGLEPYPGAEKEGLTASCLLERFPQFDLIVSGHYHRGFAICSKDQKRMLANPGGIARMTADEIDRQPYVYLWDAERNVITPVAVPIEQGVVRRDHIIQQEERSGRMDAFLSRMSQDVEIQLSFRENLQRYMVQNTISATVEQEIWKCLEVQK